MSPHSTSIITPNRFKLPRLSHTVFLFFMRHHLFMFRDLVNGGKVTSYGPAKRFSFTRSGVDYSVLGGFIGAPLAVIIAENAMVSGATSFQAFGTAGWIGSDAGSIGEIRRPATALDATGMIQDYGGSSDWTTFMHSGFKSNCQSIVSVNSFYRLTPSNLKRYRSQSIDLIDMEAAPLNHVITSQGASFQPLFVISDKVEDDQNWHYDHGSEQLQSGIEAGLHQLLSAIPA